MAAIGLPLFILSSLTRPVRQVSLEWELAVVNAEADVSLDDPVVSEFRRLLDRLDEKCFNSRREIVETCIAGYRYQKERGDLDSLLEFTRQAEQMIPRQTGGKADVRQTVSDMLTP